MTTLVIGGGLMGCSVAWRLAQAGERVRGIEKAVPGAGASSAAAGILGPQSECDAPGPLLQLGLASRAMYAEFARELGEVTGIEVEHVQRGVLHPAWTEAHAQSIAHRASWQRELGLRAELIDPQ